MGLFFIGISPLQDWLRIHVLKKTDVKLELLNDVDMLLMFEKGIRGGVSMILKRYAKANNNYMKDFNLEEESKFIQYLTIFTVGQRHIHCLPLISSR